MRQQLNISYNPPKKSLGQNFIVDKNFLSKISNFIVTDPSTFIIEVGPGRGALTDLIIKKEFRELALIEKDTVLSKNLELKYQNIDGIKIINDDALLFNYKYFHQKDNVIIVGNLPYNISTQLLFCWLEGKEWPSFYKKMILMFQKEVAERIIAKPNNKKYGRISVASQIRCSVKKLSDAPSYIFEPKPRVDGTILEFSPITDYQKINFLILKKILNASFSQRRKKIKTTLNKYIEVIRELDIDEDLRPENLTIEDYYNITMSI